MSKYFSFVLVFFLLSQVLAVPVSEDDKYESLQEVHYVQDPKPDTPLVRTIRQAEHGSHQATKKSDKPGPKPKNNGKSTASTNQPEVPPSTEPKFIEPNQQQESLFNSESSIHQDLRSVASQNQGLNENADMNARSMQDLLPQESEQQPRTHHLDHPLIDKIKGLKGGYGGEYSGGYSLGGGDYGSISYQEPIIQPVVHQKPVLFHQEVIKPIVHEIVKPLPVFHETIKPIIHEVVKTMPIVKEVIKPVPVVHEILKPYTVPVVHPVQFHHQPTQINVPMQWSCQLKPGPGGPAVSGIQNGYGSYGSYGGGSIGLSGGYGLGFGNGGSIGLGGSHGYTGAGLGTYSMPIKTLPPKYIGGHGHGLFKSNEEARDIMQDDIEDMIQREELNYSSMGPSEMSMKSMAQENPQMFGKVVDNMRQKQTNLRTNMRSNIVDFQQTPMRTQSLTTEQIQNMRMFDQGSMHQQPSLEKMRASQMDIQQIPMEQMRAVQMGMEQIPFNQRAIQIPMNQMRAAEMEQVPWVNMRSADMSMQQIPMHQMRAVQMGMEQIPFNERTIQIPINQIRAADMDLQQIPIEQMRTAQMDILTDRSFKPPIVLRTAQFDMQPSQLQQLSMQTIPAIDMSNSQMSMRQIPVERMRSAEMGFDQRRSAEMSAQDSEQS